ncbi:hypothetical protein ADP64_000055 [Achromobacter phage phiAxp-2]|uniref:Uncharacterized protein n=1 Tax=Achromobacter phage phiAxp-2 TaxID=1664246 RepID=A0A0K2FHT1_9CAUD|nr:hypothetical protein ADP64_000055 [Achromobacter phage phiAxp-2]ALA45415.1 hypothetical protein ADP64_000055 [Achromobacter phage phiAxp-2]
MGLKIIRKPDTITLTDSDVRDALVDYVERHSGREIDKITGEGIRYHPTQAVQSGSEKLYSSLFVTVTLKDEERWTDQPAAARRDTTGTIQDVKALIVSLNERCGSAHERAAMDSAISTLRHVVVLLGRLRRLEEHDGDLT